MFTSDGVTWTAVWGVCCVGEYNRGVRGGYSSITLIKFDIKVDKTELDHIIQ